MLLFLWPLPHQTNYFGRIQKIAELQKKNAMPIVEHFKLIALALARVQCEKNRIIYNFQNRKRMICFNARRINVRLQWRPYGRVRKKYGAGNHHQLQVKYNLYMSEKYGIFPQHCVSMDFIIYDCDLFRSTTMECKWTCSRMDRAIPEYYFQFHFIFWYFLFFAVDLFRILTAAKHPRTMCLHEYWYGIKWITAYVGVGEAQFNWTVPIWSISLSLSSGGEFVSMEYNIAFVNVQALSNVSALPMRRIIYILCVCVRAHSPLRER